MDPGSLSPVDQMIVAARDNVEKLGEFLERYRAFLTLRAKYGLPEELARCLDASDLVQETMLDAAGGFCNFRGWTEPEFSKWIKEIQAHTPPNFDDDHPHNFSSYHPMGANFVAGDGSVHMISDFIDEAVYHALCTRDAGDVVSNWPAGN